MCGREHYRPQLMRKSLGRQHPGIFGMQILRLVLIVLFTGRLWGQTTGTLKGAVRDSLTGELVAGVQVWVPGTFWGAVSDQNGEFAISGVHRSGFGLVARRCMGIVTAPKPSGFDPAYPKAVTLLVNPRPPICRPMPRPPWLVTPDDSVVEGYYVASWEGEPFFTCDGEFLPAAFPDSIYPRLLAFNLREGESLYVRGHRRHNDDPDWPTVLSQLIGRVLEVRRPGPKDCPRASAR